MPAPNHAWVPVATVVAILALVHLFWPGVQCWVHQRKIRAGKITRAEVARKARAAGWLYLALLLFSLARNRWQIF